MRFILYIALIILGIFWWQGSLDSIRSQESQTMSFAETEHTPLAGNVDDYFSTNSALALVSRKKVNELTDPELAGIVLMPSFEKQHSLTDIKEWIEDYHIGGMMILRNDYNQTDQQYINSVYAENNQNNLPLFTSIDAEPSLVQYRIPGLVNIPKTSQIVSEYQSRDVAARISSYIDNMGVNINFAPVYDNNTNISVIGNRSFGAEADNIDALANAFALETKGHNIIPTAKHFPGHGNVSGDTHKGLQTISGELSELPQFKSAIKNNIPMIMIGHLAIADNPDWETDGLPATLSPKITTELLRDELGFEGLVVTDALNMGALDGFANADMMALDAGADIILIPKNIKETHQRILARLENDSLFKDALREKAEHIIRMKLVLRNIQTKNAE